MSAAATALQIRSFVAVLHHDGQPPGSDPIDIGPIENREEWASMGSGRVHVWFRSRLPFVGDRNHVPVLLLGDSAEWAGDPQGAYMAGAASLVFDGASESMTIRTSLVSLPPVFLYQDDRCSVVASDPYLIAGVPDVRLELDPLAVVQLGAIGHPVQHRTLFRRTQLLPAGARITAGPGGVRVEPEWRMPPAEPAAWDAFIESQIGAFRRAVHRLDASRSVLTAGLDTRTVFAALAAENRLVPAVTISGARPSLDARTAAELCRAYSVPHQIVTLDDRFTRALPQLVQQASRFSGGLESLEQTPDIFMYHELGGRFGARLSGNLGNQVGRGGTEGVGLRGASLDILSAAVREQSRGANDGHWLLAKLDGDRTAAMEFILQQEIPFTSVGNYSVGSHFAVQQSPYADSALVATLALKPADNLAAPSGSLLRMRLRDLNHRFFGEPAHTSFQRTLLQRIGGFAARYPINYGWRASGGVSPAGFALGVATLLGMVAQKQGLDDGPVGDIVARTGLPSLHNFRRSTHWLRRHLREFTHDVLGERTIRNTGLFDVPALTRVVEEHFSGRRDHHETVVFALDVALAHQTFCTKGRAL
jgi:hypothetical protein